MAPKPQFRTSRGQLAVPRALAALE
jgi:hypothetical protein